MSATERAGKNAVGSLAALESEARVIRDRARRLRAELDTHGFRRMSVGDAQAATALQGDLLRLVAQLTAHFPRHASRVQMSALRFFDLPVRSTPSVPSAAA